MFFSYHSFSFLPFLFLFRSTCISCFPLLFLSSSNFFLPFPPPPPPPPRLPSFFLSTILFPFVFFLFYFLFPPFCCFSFSLSSLYFIFLISSSFSSPLSFSLFLFFSFSPLNFFLVSPHYQGGCYEHKG